MTLGIVLGFVLVAAMRVLQRASGKKANNMLNGKMIVWEYGLFTQLTSMFTGFILLCIAGFNGFNLLTVLCAIVTALLFAADHFIGVAVINNATLAAANMASMAGLVVPCVLGIFLFDEQMNVAQWIGVALFISSVYFFAADSKQTYEGKFSWKTVVLLILHFLMQGAVMVVQKYFAVLVPDGNVAMYNFLSFGLNAVFMLIGITVLVCYKKRDESGEKINKLQPFPKKLMLLGALVAIATFTISQTVTTLAKTVPSAVLYTVSSAISVIVTSIVGATMFGEKITWKNVVGIILGLGAIVVVNVF